MMVTPAIVGLSSVLAGVFTVASSRANRVVDGVALALFGWLAERIQSPDRAETLAAAHVDDADTVFESRTLFIAVAVGVGSGLCLLSMLPVAGSLLGQIGTALEGALPSAFVASIQLERSTVLGLTVAGSMFGAVSIAVATHELRWWLLGQRVAARRRRIEATLPRVVAFMYALSRSGMPLPRMLRLLSENRGVYGAAATELGVAVREIDTAGRDPITALAAVGERTPSPELAELTENLANVLTSGQSLSSYLQSEHDRYREAAATEQQQHLDLLSMYAEGYVTVLVVGPLFVITTLTVVGLVVTETLTALRIITFGILPLATVGFLLGVDRVLDARHVSPAGQEGDGDHSPQSAAGVAVDTDAVDAAEVADAGSDRKQCEQRATLRIYDRLKRGHRWLRDPVAAVVANPWLTLVVTVPGGLVWLGHTGQVTALGAVELIEAFTRPVSLIGIGVCGTYAVVYEYSERRRRQIERAVPDFLDRLGSLNDAGMSVIGGLKQVAEGDLGALTPELERTWQDVQWGADAETALNRLAGRVRSPLVTGAVTLVTNALRASSDIAPVLSIAADELRASQRLARNRKRLMRTYLLVIYVAVVVFVGIVIALSASFLPAIETAGHGSTAAAASSVGGSGGASGSVPAAGRAGVAASAVGAYESLFFQIAAVQAVCSGVVAGKLGEGRLRAGVKHVAILLCLVHLGFRFV